MKHIIMILIVLGLIVVDYATGVIKAYVNEDVSSKKMRIGGLNKLSEVLVMLATCGLEIGINELGKYYQSTELAGIAGLITASGVFLYIVIMELVSILENYAAINPEASWIGRIVKKLRTYNEDKEGDADNDRKSDK